MYEPKVELGGASRGKRGEARERTIDNCDSKQITTKIAHRRLFEVQQLRASKSKPPFFPCLDPASLLGQPTRTSILPGCASKV